jgi:hypothetical protein
MKNKEGIKIALEIDGGLVSHGQVIRELDLQLVL